MWLKGGLSSWRTKIYKKINNRKFPLWNWSVFEDVEFSLLKKNIMILQKKILNKIISISIIILTI